MQGRWLCGSLSLDTGRSKELPLSVVLIQRVHSYCLDVPMGPFTTLVSFNYTLYIHTCKYTHNHHCCVLHRSPVLCPSPLTTAMSFTDHQCCVLHRSPVLCPSPLTTAVSFTDHQCCVLHCSPVLCSSPPISAVSFTDHQCCVLHRSPLLCPSPITPAVSFTDHQCCVLYCSSVLSPSQLTSAVSFADMEKFPLRMKDNDLLVSQLFEDPNHEAITTLSVYLTPAVCELTYLFMVAVEWLFRAVEWLLGAVKWLLGVAEWLLRPSTETGTYMCVCINLFSQTMEGSINSG